MHGRFISAAVIALALGCPPAAAASAAAGAGAAGPVLRGIVVGPDRAPVSGARLGLARGNPAGQASGAVEIETHSNAAGEFRFEEIPAGDWILSCEADGLSASSRAVRIAGSGAVQPDVVIRMQPGAALPDSPIVEARGAKLRARREALEAAQQTASAQAGEAGAPGETAGARVTGLPIEDRWRVPLPAWDRYPGRGIKDAPGEPAGAAGAGAHLNPYRKNLLKGDYPIFGQNTFLVLQGVSDSFLEARTLPAPSGASAARPDSSEFFGERRQYQGAETVLVSAELFRGNAGFRPVDWRVRATAGAQFNWTAVREQGIVSVDVREGADRTDEHAGIQELFVEAKLADIGRRHDFVSLRVGVQGFVSDARGFLFVDNQPGVRLFGSLLENRLQWNLAGFEMLEKDTNSGLNTTHRRHQRVGVANIAWQDAFVPGYTLSASVHVNDDTAGSDDAGGDSTTTRTASSSARRRWATSFRTICG